MGIKRNGADIVDQVVEAMGRWVEYARQAGVPADRVRSIGSRHRLF